MRFVPVKTPWLLKTLFSNYTWNIKVDKKVLYLTFDDGPTPEITDWTLDMLSEYKAKATFFCIGNNIEKHPEIFNRIHEEGHAIGNHTFNHPKGWKTTSDAYVEEVVKTQKFIDPIYYNSKKKPKLFRPPYGQIKPRQGKALLNKGFRIIMWDILAFDWEDTISNEKCYQNVISKARPGSIIVFHDSIKASKCMQYALPKVLDYFSEKGYEFRRIPE